MAARFVMSATRQQALTDTGLPEFGLVGRSNVGKSTLLGALLKQSRLVRTSRTPGQTQALNLFVWDERIALVDLPGYGYAKLSHQTRARLGRLVGSYIEHRHGLLGVVLMLDARRQEATEADRDMAAHVLRSERALLLAVTKADLVPKPKRLSHLRRVESAMGVPAGCAVLCSGRTGDGVAELRKRLLELSRGLGKS